MKNNLFLIKINTILTIFRYKLLEYINFTFDFINWPTLKPEIDELIYVDPLKITKAVSQRFSKGYLKNLHIFDKTVATRYPKGTVINGDWDLNLHDIFTEKSGERIKILIDLYSSSNQLEKKKHQDKLVSFLLKNNKDFTKNDALDELKRADNIFNAIKDKGFKNYYFQNYNLFFFKFKTKCKSGIRVSIGRNGEIIWIGSHHRIAIAKVLKFDKIPALVYYRHYEWQKKRFDMVKNKFFGNYTNHPDVKKFII